jgi:isopenicillin-N epimerase
MRSIEFGLDPEITFLNHGSFGACPKDLLLRQRLLQDELEAEPVRFLGRELERRLDHARLRTCAFLNADPNGFAWMRNATQGVNTVLRSLTFKPGDELLVTNQEYNACRNALDVTAERWGAKVVVCTIPFPLTSSEQVVEAIVRSATSRTKLLLIDWITSPTGLIFPIHKIVREMETRGIPTLVDAAHAPGQVEIDLRTLGAPFVTGNFHKWLNTPKGSAFLHVREDWTSRIRPLAISHGANSPRTDRSRFLLEFGFTGTDDPTAWVIVPEAIEFFESRVEGGWNGLRAMQREQVLRARDLILNVFEMPSAPAPDDMIGSMAAVPIPERFSDLKASRPEYFHRWQEVLFEDHHIEVPFFFWKEGDALRWTIRVSGHLYTRNEHFEKLVNILRSQCLNMA